MSKSIFDGAGILFKTVTEALVSNIEERNQLVLNADVNNLGPLFLSQVIACGIEIGRASCRERVC